MKMIYASATKGTFALHAAVLTAAHKLGLSSEYFDELILNSKYTREYLIELSESVRKSTKFTEKSQKL